MAHDADGFAIEVDQSFGNCSKYIQSRALDFVPAPERAEPALESAWLSPEAVGLLERTDTTFLATSSREAAAGGREGVDVSHRGGLPGFIRVDSEPHGSRLTLPDFSGNFMFNSFGNLEVNPHAGLLAFDFTTGDVLSLTGTARVLWETSGGLAGAERLLEMRVTRGLRWRSISKAGGNVEVSPHLRGMGVWPR